MLRSAKITRLFKTADMCEFPQVCGPSGPLRCSTRVVCPAAAKGILPSFSTLERVSPATFGAGGISNLFRPREFAQLPQRFQDVGDPQWTMETTIVIFLDLESRT